MGSTYNLQEDCMLFHGDLTKLRRQRESLVSKKAIGKTTTLYMQHAILILLRHHHSDILCEKHTEFGRRNTQIPLTLHTCYLCKAFTPTMEPCKFCLQESVQQFARVSIGMATYPAFTMQTVQKLSRFRRLHKSAYK